MDRITQILFTKNSLKFTGNRVFVYKKKNTKKGVKFEALVQQKSTKSNIRQQKIFNNDINKKVGLFIHISLEKKKRIESMRYDTNICQNYCIIFFNIAIHLH